MQPLRQPSSAGPAGRSNANGNAIDGASSYLDVLHTCNTLIHNLGKNLWSKFFPNENPDKGNVSVKFDIEPGDSTPRRVLACLAKQVHNFKCVAKILDCVKEAEIMLKNLDFDDDEQPRTWEVDLTLLSGISSQLTVLAKCDAAMRRRHSVRHRVLTAAGAAKPTCFALSDIDCPVLGIRLSQLDSYTLLDNSDPQSWLVEEPRTGRKLRVPPLFLAIDAESAELARIGRARTGLSEVARKLVAGLAGQLSGLVKAFKTEEGQEDVKQVLSSNEAMKSFAYRLQMLERYLRILAGIASEAQMSPGDWHFLTETTDVLMEKMQQVLAAKPVSIGAQIIKMEKGLVAMKTFAHANEVSERLRNRETHGAGSSGLRSFRSGRSHQLTAPQRRTSVFEFEFEFLESTKRTSTISKRTIATSKSSSETVTRHNQEVARKFVIKSVWDGRKEISLQDAVDTGVLDFQRGVYTELLGNRQEMPLEAAMSAGKISVEMVTKQQVSEDSSSFGVISIEETRTASDGTVSTTSVSQVVHGVVDVAAKKILSFQEAAQLGIIDRETGAFTNTETGEVMTPADAISKNFLKIYKTDDPHSLNIDPSNRVTAQNFNKLKSRWGAVSSITRSLKNADNSS